MLHDGMMDRYRPVAGRRSDRAEPRVPFPGELLLSWLHDMNTRIRYRIVDASDHGFRIRTSLPLAEGMTGIAMKLLPEGTLIDRAVWVMWSNRVRDHSDPGPHFEAGLRLQ